MKAIKPERLMQAHQYLYYIKCAPIWSDYDYDMWCRSHGLFGGGGSSLEKDYDYTIRLLADDMARHPFRFPCKYNLQRALNYLPSDTINPKDHEQTK